MTRKRDTRNNWITLQFVTKCRYECFRRQSIIDSCIAGFRELEAFGFEFGEMGFPLDHSHISLNLPKKYSMQDALIMLKDHSAKRSLLSILVSGSAIQEAAFGRNTSIINRLGIKTKTQQKPT